MKKHGHYELSKKQEKALLAAIEEWHGIDPSSTKVLRTQDTSPNECRLNAVIGRAHEDETLFVTYGCSAKKAQENDLTHIEGCQYNYVEVFLRLNAAEPDEELIKTCYILIYEVCKGPEDESEELEIFTGYEYRSFDGMEEWQKQSGYYGAIVGACFPIHVSSIGNIMFYQMVPLHRSEIQFIERQPDCKRSLLCGEIMMKVAEKRFFDIPAPALTEAELNEIMREG